MMKRLLAMALVLAIGAVAGHAGTGAGDNPGGSAVPGAGSNVPAAVNPKVLEKNFLWALNFDVDGVVEDALREIAKAKLEDPAFESKAIVEKVGELAEHGNSPAIRYRASLTKIVYEHPELFCGENLQCCKDGEELFSGIVHCLERSRYAQ